VRETPPSRAAPARAAGRALVLAALVVPSLAACASAPAEDLPRQPYKVVLLPVEGAAEALAMAPESDEAGGARVPLAMTPAELERTIADAVRSSRVFSAVVEAGPGELDGADVDERLRAASAFARRERADLVLRVTVKSAQMNDLGNNSSTVWSTLTWFMVPLPVWFIEDRTYSTNIAVQAELFEPGEAVVKPTSTVVASSGNQDLDLWDRGLSPWVLVVPPPFLPGSERSVSETLTRRAVAQLLEGLVAELRTRPVPSRFEVTAVAAEGGVAVEVVTRRKLRSLEVESEGRRLALWAETELEPAADSTPERSVYRRTVPLPAATAGATQLVRVVAEDEAGVREVRTVAVERRP
jgi:hypothetical protein